MQDDARKQLIAGRLREARRLSGLSQGQVAAMLNLHRPSVSEMEAGKRQVSAEELRKLAEIYDVGLAFLLGQTPEALEKDDPKIQLAARELSKLSPDALDRLMRALAAFRTEDDEAAH
jgi:transcriptional regulator with XRE-family HTH domain